jgi:transcriptional regulator with XRE-family HTH domain
MDYKKAFGVIRAAKNLSQKDLAKILDVTPSYISRIERGERSPSPEIISLLCERLNIPLALFMLLGQKYSQLSTLDKRLLDDLGKELLKIITKD